MSYFKACGLCLLAGPIVTGTMLLTKSPLFICGLAGFSAIVISLAGFNLGLWVVDKREIVVTPIKFGFRAHWRTRPEVHEADTSLNGAVGSLIRSSQDVSKISVKLLKG